MMFSIVIPLFNKSSYILRSVKSVLLQSFQDFELLLVDDGSTDDSVELLEKEIEDPRLRIIRKENGGVSSARNRGIAEAKYNYICFLDADDIWHPEFLKSIAHTISIHPNLEIVGVRFEEVPDGSSVNFKKEPFDSQQDAIKLKDYFRQASKSALFHSSSTTVRKDVFEKVGKFDEKLSHGEDIDMWFRIMLNVREAYYIPKYLSYYFVGNSEQATSKLPPLEKHLVGSLFLKYKHQYLNTKVPYFKEFVNEYLLVNLRPFYMRDSEQKQVENILSELVAAGGKMNWFYRFPRLMVKGIYYFKKRFI